MCLCVTSPRTDPAHQSPARMGDRGRGVSHVTVSPVLPVPTGNVGVIRNNQGFPKQIRSTIVLDDVLIKIT